MDTATLVFLLKALKAMIEVAGFTYIAQGFVGLFSGSTRDQNFIYVILRIITNPVTKLARLLSPRFIPDRHIPFVGFGLVLWAWFAVVLGLFYILQTVLNS